MKSIEMSTMIIFVSGLDAADELLNMLPGIKVDKHIIKNPIGKEVSLEKINTMMSEPLACMTAGLASPVSPVAIVVAVLDSCTIEYFSDKSVLF